MWTTIRSFNTRNFRVVLDCEPERDPDVSWMEPEDLAKLDSGEWENVTFRVRVLYRGAEVGADYLGNSVYADVSDFAREHIGIRPKARAAGHAAGSYFSDMVRQAIAEARKDLCDMPRIRCA